MSERGADFWLSHHNNDELDRTYALGPLHICARCLGTYPMMFIAIGWQIAHRVPLEWRYDGIWSIALMLPATIDWAFGRFRPHSGSNLWRTASGILLGLALSRTLYIHMQAPFPLWLLVQAAVATAVALPVLALSYRQRTRR